MNHESGVIDTVPGIPAGQGAQAPPTGPALPASQSKYCGAAERERSSARARSSERSRERERQSQTAGNFFALPVTVSVLDFCTFIDTLSVTLSNE